MKAYAMFSDSTYKFLGSPHPVLFSGSTSRCKHLEFVVFNVNLLRHRRTVRKVTLLNYHRCVIDPADGAREVCRAFELSCTIPTMNTPDAYLPKSKTLLPPFFWYCEEGVVE